MTTALFQRWLENFNTAMRDEKHNVLLLLDNASCHRISNELSNVCVHMLPPTQPRISSHRTLASFSPSKHESTQ